MLPFAVGREYPRHELLGFLGSRQGQSGVLWGNEEPYCVICTSGGRHGKKAGYSDEAMTDGSWWYFGQGTKGDQNLNNAANSKLASRANSVLLFTTREPTAKEISAQGNYGKLFAFRGSFHVAGYEIHVPPHGTRKGDRLLRFRLVPICETPSPESPQDTEVASLSLTQLRMALNDTLVLPAASATTVIQYRQRSAQVQRYARMRANGHCESCRSEAPFCDGNGKPFLEVHHLRRLADDGPDSPVNVAALCPNCHRRAHHGADRFEFNAQLISLIASIEAEHS